MTERQWNSWWKERFGFYKTSNPLFGIYNDLRKTCPTLKRSDLDYIETMRKVYCANVTGLIHAKDLISHQVIGGTNIVETSQNSSVRGEKIKRRFISQATRDSSSKPTTLLSHPKAIRKGTREAVRELLPNLEDGVIRKEIEDRTVEIYKSAVKKDEKERRERIRAGIKNPLAKVILEYLPIKRSDSVGAPGNTLGSFVLLAVSEHLRLRSGEPHFRFAGEFLKTIDGSQKSMSSRQIRETAKQRVSQLQKSHLKWRHHLKIFAKALAGFRRSTPPT